MNPGVEKYEVADIFAKMFLGFFVFVMNGDSSGCMFFLF